MPGGSALEVHRDHRPEMVHPAPDGLIGYHDAAGSRRKAPEPETVSTGVKDFTATVDCFGKGGGTGGGPAPADSQFDLLFLW
jgi:hypothetical protein